MWQKPGWHLSLRSAKATHCGRFASLDGPIDFLLLDGWKDMYLPMLKTLSPKMHPGTVVLADNIFTFKKALRPYVDYMQNRANGFDSVSLPIGSGHGMEYSVRRD